MSLQATEEGSHPPAGAAATADPYPTGRPLALGGSGGAKRSAVVGLPDDALVEILSRLPAKFLCRSKCVSKGWCDLIADRLRCRKLPHSLEGFFYGCLDVVDSDSDCDLCSKDSYEDEDRSADSYEDEDWEDDDECGCNGYKLKPHHVNRHMASYDDGGSEDDDGGDSEDYWSEDHDEVSSEDYDECRCNECEQKPHHVCGHFVNLLGKSVPLVDPLFSFLRKQPGIENLTLLDSCNGLLLFGHTQDPDIHATTSYIVYNPATEHWLRVPSSSPTSVTSDDEDSDSDVEEAGVSTYLIFDPVASSHFELIKFCSNLEVAGVRTYSSETKRWMDGPIVRSEDGGGWDLRRTIASKRGSTCFKKMLHLIVSPSSIGPELIAAFDGTGKICRVIRWLENRGFPVFVGQSKGLLHCLSVTGHPDGSFCHMSKLSIWVLEDYDAEKWSLKHTVSFSELFGRDFCQFGSDYNVVTIHPDRNVVFFVQHWDYKLISYDLDREEVCDLCSVGRDYGIITPYVPYFSEMPVLSKKH